jgi:molybdate transport system ATP-binding protein
MNQFLDADFERRFERGPTIRAALRQSLAEFSVTALVGPSGCGKTTILRCLAGLDLPQNGRISYGDETWFDGSRRVYLRPQQRGIGYLFQEYALFPHLTVSENIAFGLGSSRGAPRAAIGERVRELLDMLQLAGLAARYPHQLSGGQQQRVALARTVAPRPRLLLLDEPLSALDSPTRAELREELRRVLAEWAIPTLIVTHDAAEVAAFADYVVVLCDGRIRQQGPVSEVFQKPTDAEVARITGGHSSQGGLQSPRHFSSCGPESTLQS